MSKKLDVIIFGATGFTGKHTVYEAVSILSNLTWGVAGRNEAKLRKTLEEVSAKCGKDLSKVPTIIADVSDESSLQTMAKQCRMVVNCCGPYRFYGENVVKACVKEGTHHVDVSGEPQYMENMQLKYSEEAETKGVYIVSACGFDSIPADMGVVFMEDNFNGTLNSVETYLESSSEIKASGPALNYGTWESAVYGVFYSGELKTLRTALYPQRLPSFSPKLKFRGPVHKSEVINKYCVPFLGSDKSVVKRSQRYMYEKMEKRPVQMEAYFGVGSLFSTCLAVFAGIMFGIMTKFSLGRYLLLNYPKICSFGYVSKDEGPSEIQMESALFKMTFACKGWEEKVSDTNAPSKKMLGLVSGKNPGYGGTCVALLYSAVMILEENNKIPGKGGVLPPGAAFSKTSLIEKLTTHQRGFKFEILK